MSVTTINASLTYTVTGTGATIMNSNKKSYFRASTGAKVKCKNNTITVNGVKYAEIVSCDKFTKTGTTFDSSVVGKYIDMRNLAAPSNTSSSTSDGTNKIVPKMWATPAKVWVLEDNKCVIFTKKTINGTENLYAGSTKKKKGDTFTVYATWVGASGTFAAIDSTCTTWVKYMEGIKLVSYLSVTDPETGKAAAGDPAPTTPPSNPVTNNTPTSVDTSGPVTGAGTTITLTDDWEYQDINEVIDEANRISGNKSTDMLTAMHKMQFCIGIPPKITEAADPRYMTGLNPANDFGRTYAELFMMQNTVFSIQPVKVKYLPGFSKDAKKGFMDIIMANVSNMVDDEAGIGRDGSGLSGQLFETQPDYNVYINTVNLIARVMSIYLGIGDKPYPGTSIPFKHMDYSFYRDKTKFKKSSGILGFLSDAFRSGYRAIMESVVNDDTYIHFYTTADGTSMSDAFSVSTKSSGLESLFNNNLSELGSEIQFMLGGSLDGSVIDEIGQGAVDMISGTLDTLGDPGQMLGNMVRYGANYLKGGRLVFPQMLDDCNYDRSYSCSSRFISPSGDKQSIFINCYLPLAYILPFVMPQMLSDNMYRYPMLAKVDVPSMVHAELCAITNLRIQRGGPDGQSFTADGLPFEVSISFDITPLYSKLMVTNARHPILFLSNDALHEYLGSMCGVSFTGYALQLKANIAMSLFKDVVTDTTGSMLRSWWDSPPANVIRNIFTF